MYDAAAGVKDLLVAAGVGTFGATSGWGIFLGRFQDIPDTAIQIAQTGGLSPWPHLLLNFPSVQTLVRGGRNGYEEGRTKIDEVVNRLLGIPAQTIGSDWWQGITQVGDVGFLGYDENHRPLFTANFNIIVEPAAGQYRQSI